MGRFAAKIGIRDPRFAVDVRAGCLPKLPKFSELVIFAFLLRPAADQSPSDVATIPKFHYDPRRFRHLANGRTTILISHRFSTVSMADRIIMLDEGRVIETGSHQELLEKGGAYASLYQLHQRQMGEAE